MPKHCPSPADYFLHNQFLWFVYEVNIQIKIIVDDITSCSNEIWGDNDSSQKYFSGITGQTECYIFCKWVDDTGVKKILRKRNKNKIGPTN